jgi:hypothetical protein
MKASRLVRNSNSSAANTFTDVIVGIDFPRQFHCTFYNTPIFKYPDVQYLKY